MRSGGNTWTGTTAAAVVVVTLAGPLAAQDRGGLEASLTFAQGLTLSNEGDSFGQTDLGFSLSSITRSQTFAFDISTAITERFDDGLTTEIVDPTINLSYSIESRQTRLETSFRYRQSDADAIVDGTGDLIGLLVLDDGTRADQSANLAYTFGREARFGGVLTLGYAETDFDGTTSTELIDSRTDSAGLNLRFEIDRRITGTLGYNIARTDRASGRDVIDERLRVGADLAVTQTLNANLSFGQSRITTDTGFGETVDRGASYAVSLTQERPTGALSFALSSDITEAGRRTSATFGHSFETRRGAFSYKIGATESDTSKLQPLFELSYTEELARGSLGVDLSQNFSTTTDGLDALNSRVQVNWNQNLTRSSRLGTDLTYQMTEIIGADTDSSRLDVGIRYSHDLTADWALTTRYVHSRFDANGQTDRQENDLFIGLETTLGWRP